MRRPDRIGLIPQGLAALESEAIDYAEIRKRLSVEIGSSVLNDTVVENTEDDISQS